MEEKNAEGNVIKDEDFIQVKSLKQYFPVSGNSLLNRQYVKAVDDVSFSIRKGETLGLVGESGCGKSTLGRTLLQLYVPTGGEVIFDGQKLGDLRKKEMKSFRKRMQLIFQDPSACLNPRKTVREILMEPYRIHRVGTEKEREQKVLFLMDRVGLESYYLSRYPHEMSGGQKQRVGIARALALKPELIVCDEAVSALDVSIQAQVINLLEQLQEEFSLTYLFISHNLSIVHHISDRVAVMYLGKMVELGSDTAIYENPCHPYSQALISAIPNADCEKDKSRILLTGDVPSPVNPPSGCRFHTRCRHCREICRQEEPGLREIEPDHYVACHLFG
ncbi:MAG: dipeptide ABC transporter ATP-binding protein [Lachnospiraceae bacterium]|nr:dipeptide ABC transporter ATP-binding protein [Lachnospiraceae bacterium]